ncbi:IS3 family transposase [Fibrella forsythiae]|uniref:IS3 family transposase n=1 Tax=Fibrella forsythiae TaxID=2817061 RepID=A0ABS3JTK3_9BACT|nr:IS3 family transposase [Fibrella forsythiae]
MGLSRNALAEPAVIKQRDKVLSSRIEQLARWHKHGGVLKIDRRLRKQGELVNHMRVRGLYRSLGLSLRRKTKKRLPDAVRQPLAKARACNQCWSLDFTSDTLTGGRKFRTLKVVDDYNREALGMEIDYSLPARRVTCLVDQLVERFGKPERLRSDTGPEFISQAMEDWCNHPCIELCWIEPGKPTQNAHIERFHGTSRRDVLDAHIFTSSRHVRQTVDAWLVEYNTERPDQALPFMTPVEYRQVA